jgi:hypothetical protein
VSFVLACFQDSAAPRLENSDSDEKDALFGLGTQVTNVVFARFAKIKFIFLSTINNVFWPIAVGKFILTRTGELTVYAFLITVINCFNCTLVRL